MKIKPFIVLVLGFTSLAISFHPMALMFREVQTQQAIESRYIVQHADHGDGFPMTLQAPEITVNNNDIKIVEEKTGRIAPLTPWDRDEGVPPGEIVKVKIELNGKSIADPTEMWLSNRERGSRYFSWLDVLKVQDQTTGESRIAIVQRLTDDDEPMDNRQWRIIHVNEDGEWEQETFSYLERSGHPLGVKLVMVSGTSRMAMGYHSDIMQGYPTLIFPLLYPWLTTALGIFLILVTSSLLLFMKLRRTA